MKFCVVYYSFAPGVPHAPPLVRSLIYVRSKVPFVLKKHGLASADVEEWELLTLDNRVLLRTGTIYPTRRLTWHKTRA